MKKLAVLFLGFCLGFTLKAYAISLTSPDLLQADDHPPVLFGASDEESDFGQNGMSIHQAFNPVSRPQSVFSLDIIVAGDEYQALLSNIKAANDAIPGAEDALKTLQALPGMISPENDERGVYKREAEEIADIVKQSINLLKERVSGFLAQNGAGFDSLSQLKLQIGRVTDFEAARAGERLTNPLDDPGGRRLVQIGGQSVGRTLAELLTVAGVAQDKQTAILTALHALGDAVDKNVSLARPVASDIFLVELNSETAIRDAAARAESMLEILPAYQVFDRLAQALRSIKKRLQHPRETLQKEYLEIIGDSRRALTAIKEINEAAKSNEIVAQFLASAVRKERLDALKVRLEQIVGLRDM